MGLLKNWNYLKLYTVDDLPIVTGQIFFWHQYSLIAMKLKIATEIPYGMFGIAKLNV